MLPVDTIISTCHTHPLSYKVKPGWSQAREKEPWFNKFMSR